MVFGALLALLGVVTSQGRPIIMIVINPLEFISIVRFGTRFVIALHIHDHSVIEGCFGVTLSTDHYNNLFYLDRCFVSDGLFWQ